jgi:predicted nucleotidyltransferase component of viral defense system
MDILNETQRNRAIVEDEIVDLILKHFENFVMHGGTAVWRCYGGNRFSRDIDFYSNITASAESAFQKQLHKLLTENGYPIREEKYNNRTKTLHVIFRGNETTVKLDITFMNAKGIATEYLRVDGSKRIIRALSPEELLNEKVDAYSDKYASGAHEIQDLYDIIILKDRLSNLPKALRAKLTKFLSEIRTKPPSSERELKQLLLNGVAPSFGDMISILERWLDDTGK